MSVTTIEFGSVHTDTLEFMRGGAVVTSREAAGQQVYLEDRQNMRVISGLLIQAAQGTRNASAQLPEALRAADPLVIARRLGHTLMRREEHRVFCASLETLDDHPSLADLLVVQARDESVDVLFMAEGNHQRQDHQRRDFGIIRRLIADFPNSPLFGVNTQAAHLRHLPSTWQQEIKMGIQSRQTATG